MVALPGKELSGFTVEVLSERRADVRGRGGCAAIVRREGKTGTSCAVPGKEALRATAEPSQRLQERTHRPRPPPPGSARRGLHHAPPTAGVTGTRFYGRVPLLELVVARASNATQISYSCRSRSNC